MLNVIHLPNLSPEIFTVDIGVMSFTLRWYAVATAYQRSVKDITPISTVKISGDKFGK